MEWKKARKKPIIIEYREVNGEAEVIKTREGEIKGFHGQDFIIKGINGELYPIKKNIFYKTYDVIKEVNPTSKEVSFNQSHEIVTCPRCHYAVLREDMSKVFENKCPRCGTCIACDSV